MRRPNKPDFIPQRPAARADSTFGVSGTGKRCRASNAHRYCGRCSHCGKYYGFCGKGHTSIAFCCISTGAFHFPNQEAAEIAVAAVREFLRRHGGIQVVFNVFKDSDLKIYQRLLGTDAGCCPIAPPRED